MSTAERIKPRAFPPLENGQHLDQPTFHERYKAMPDGTWAELVGGVVHMPSPMRGDHGKTSRIVAGWLYEYERYTPGVEGADAATVKLDLKGEPQPDHSLLILPDLGGRSGVDPGGYYTGAPEMVVEVARSSRHFDLNEKKADYERVGVLEYVVVELAPNRIHWFVRRGRRFVALRPGRDGIYRSKVFPGLWLDPDALFRRRLSQLSQALDQGLASPEHAAFVAKLAAAGRGEKPR